MNTPRVSERDYIDFLVATPKVASACEAASCQPDVPKAPRPRRLLTALGPGRTRHRNPLDRPR